jgi:hypothetical protein
VRHGVLQRDRHCSRLIALTSGELLGLDLLGFLSRRGDGRSAALAIGATLVLSLYRAVSPAPWFPEALRVAPLDAVHGYYTALLAHAVMFGVGWRAGVILPKRRTREATAAEAIGA